MLSNEGIFLLFNPNYLSVITRALRRSELLRWFRMVGLMVMVAWPFWTDLSKLLTEILTQNLSLSSCPPSTWTKRYNSRLSWLAMVCR